MDFILAVQTKTLSWSEKRPIPDPQPCKKRGGNKNLASYWNVWLYDLHAWFNVAKWPAAEPLSADRDADPDPKPGKNIDPDARCDNFIGQASDPKSLKKCGIYVLNLKNN